MQRTCLEGKLTTQKRASTSQISNLQVQNKTKCQLQPFSFQRVWSSRLLTNRLQHRMEVSSQYFETNRAELKKSYLWLFVSEVVLGLLRVQTLYIINHIHFVGRG